MNLFLEQIIFSFFLFWYTIIEVEDDYSYKIKDNGEIEIGLGVDSRLWLIVDSRLGVGSLIIGGNSGSEVDLF